MRRRPSPYSRSDPPTTVDDAPQEGLEQQPRPRLGEDLARLLGMLGEERFHLGLAEVAMAMHSIP